MTLYWRKTSAVDDRARQISERHYNRQTPGARFFSPPGYKIVLVTANYRALWISHRVHPSIARMDGYECWSCSTFRNESSRLSSVLIRQAVEVTLAEWAHQPIPRDGFITYVDPNKVASPPDGMLYGYTYMLAGWEHIGISKGGLHTLQLSRERLLALTPRPVAHVNGSRQLSLLEVPA